MQEFATMTGKLDEISAAIGALQADMRNVAGSIDQNRVVANERHRENLGRLDKIERKLDPLDETVRAIKPIVDQFQISRAKLVGAFVVISPIVVFVGWLLTLVGTKVIEWTMGKFH